MSIIRSLVGACNGDAWVAALVATAAVGCIVCIALLLIGDWQYRKGGK